MIRIELANSISINWNLETQEIAKDSLFISIYNRFDEFKIEIANQISNTSNTPARICGSNKYLVVGDVAFLLINMIDGIPYMQVLGVQWDSYEYNCNYPVGMLDYIADNRDDVKIKIEKWVAR